MKNAALPALVIIIIVIIMLNSSADRGKAVDSYRIPHRRSIVMSRASLILALFWADVAGDLVSMHVYSSHQPLIALLSPQAEVQRQRAHKTFSYPVRDTHV